MTTMAATADALPAGWATAALGEVCTIVSGATPKTSVDEFWDGDVRWATPKDLSDLDQKFIRDTPRKLTATGLRSCAAQLLPAGSVLLSSRAPIGLVAINTVPMATNQGFKSLVPNSAFVDSSFLYWWLKTHRSDLEAMGRGATFKEISKAITASITIPLPPIEEQRQIAAVLDQADELRAKRRAALALLDTLTESIFLDMFGDPVTNPMGLPVRALGTLGTVLTGNTPPRERREYFGDAIEWVKTDNIEPPNPYLTAAREGLSAAGRLAGRVVPAGSVLVTCIAGSPTSIGNAAIADREVAFNQQMNALVPTAPYSLYVHALLRASKVLIRASSTNSMKGMISKSRFTSIMLPIADLPLQAAFERRSRHVQVQRSLHEAAVSQAEALFVALHHRAFRGEL